MRAFKFRSASQILWVLDIIFRQRLYCADWKDLNDPMEAMFHPSYAPGVDVRAEVEKLIREKQRLRVCSLSKVFTSPILWCHYADSFRGLAVEVEIERQKVEEIKYGVSHPCVSLSPTNDYGELARNVLGCKFEDWRPEQEVRILHTEKYFPMSKPVRGLIVGHRMDAASVAVLKEICQQKGLRLSKTVISDGRIDEEPIVPLSNARRG